MTAVDPHEHVRQREALIAQWSEWVWRRVRWLTAIEFTLWLIFNLALVGSAEALAEYAVAGVPLVFLVFLLGSLPFYLALATVYAVWVNRWEARARAAIQYARAPG